MVPEPKLKVRQAASEAKLWYIMKSMAAWPSGKAGDCKSLTPSSNLGAALIFHVYNHEFFVVFHEFVSHRLSLALISRIRVVWAI
jgi:hypothetical protein